MIAYFLTLLIAEVQGGGTLKYLMLSAFMVKHKYVAVHKVVMYHVQHIHAVHLRILEYLFDTCNPFVGIADFALGLIAFVAPMGGDALFGYVIHTFGTYLHLDIGPVRGKHRKVQSLITVGFRVHEPVSYPVRPVVIYGCDKGENSETFVPFLNYVIARRSENDAHRVEVTYLVESDMLGVHLVPYGIRSLDPFLHYIVNPCLIKGTAYGLEEIIYHGLLIYCPVVDHIDYMAISLGFFVS